MCKVLATRNNHMGLYKLGSTLIREQEIEQDGKGLDLTNSK